MEGNRVTLAVLVGVYCLILGAYAGRWMLRRTNELEQLQRRVWNLELERAKPAEGRARKPATAEA